MGRPGPDRSLPKALAVDDALAVGDTVDVPLPLVVSDAVPEGEVVPEGVIVGEGDAVAEVADDTVTDAVELVPPLVCATGRRRTAARLVARRRRGRGQGL